MKIILKTKTFLGKLSLDFMILFFICLILFFLFIYSGEKGGDSFFSNLKLTIPYILAIVFATLSFFIGSINIIKNKEYSVLVCISVLLGFFVFLWFVLEIKFSH